MNRRSFATVWACLLASAWFLGGCSDSPQRQAGKNLRQQAAESQRSYEKALALVGGPVYRLAGEPLPLRAIPSKAEPDQFKFDPPPAVNDNARKLLDSAPLDRAIEENPQAEAADRSMAFGQAGRICELKGLCFAWRADGARSQIRNLLEESMRNLSVLRTLGSSRSVVQAYLTAYSADAKAKDLLTWAQGQAGEKATKLQALSTEIQTLSENAKTARTLLEKLSKEAGDLRLESKATRGKAGLDLADKAIEKQTAANKAASDLAAAENALTAKEAQRADMVTEANVATKMVAIGETSLQSLKDAAGKFQAEKDAIDGNIAEYQKRLDVLAGQMADLIKGISTDEASARAAFGEANQRFGAAQAVWAGMPMTEGGGKMVRIDDEARKAELRMIEADLGRSCLALRAGLDALAAEVKQVWPSLDRPNEMPGIYAKLGPDYLPDPAKARDDAQKNCLEAIAAYREMVMKVEPNVKWAYQTLVGSSYLCLYDLTKDRKDLTEAATNLAEAVKDKQYSPYLTNAVEINRRVQELLVSAPGK